MTVIGLSGNICRFLVLLSIIGVLSPSVAEMAKPTSKSLVGETDTEILPVESAFQIIVAKKEDFIEVRWLIAPGYYVYRDKIFFSPNLDGIYIPKGDSYHDMFFGEVEVYFDELEVIIPLTSKKSPVKDFKVSFQGCSELGFCYPSQTRDFNF